MTRKVSQPTLARAGHDVITAGDGEEGLHLAIGHKPDLIVLDMMLPKLSGPDVLHALRKNAATVDIPVMVLTSLAQSNEQRLISEGATAYFERSLLTLDQGSAPFIEAAQKMLAQHAKANAGAAGA